MDSPGYLTLGRAGLVHWSPGWFLGGGGQEAATSSPSLPALSLKATATNSNLCLSWHCSLGLVISAWYSAPFCHKHPKLSL